MANLVVQRIDGMLSKGMLCYCRAGFEPELAAELGERAALAGFSGHARTERNSGHVLFLGVDGRALSRALPFADLIFARQKLVLLAELRELGAQDQRTHDHGMVGQGMLGQSMHDQSRTDRISPILAALSGLRPFGSLLVEHSDSDAGKPLAGLARAFGNALRPALRKAGLLTVRDDPAQARLHVFFIEGDHVLIACSDPLDSSPWPLGIPRLRLHADAPSRSALKLEEALLTLLDGRHRARLLQPGMRAADLGAAPGGWSWVLARQGLRVTAIDNGPLRPDLLDSGLVEHLRADGFGWQPSQPLDWMVCDMVEQPRRVAVRMATWFREGWCRHAIFNLKLPMKKRWDETRLCLDLFAEQAQTPLTIRARQLYHDREEITVLVVPQALR